MTTFGFVDLNKKTHGVVEADGECGRFDSTTVSTLRYGVFPQVSRMMAVAMATMVAVFFPGDVAGGFWFSSLSSSSNFSGYVLVICDKTVKSPI